MSIFFLNFYRANCLRSFTVYWCLLEAEKKLLNISLRFCLEIINALIFRCGIMLVISNLYDNIDKRLYWQRNFSIPELLSEGPV